jgi:hypothetical protein
VIHDSNQKVIQRLDNNFFKVRFDRLTPVEKRFLRAMAELGPQGVYRISEVVDILGINSAGLSPVRAKTMQKGMTYSPSHGNIAFTVPLFSEFMLRAIPEFE